eukprot:TRINITY_DN5452_c0_g1_i1.p2 TRINITY_DN5452_c0_g1~~TRINITY_DN5452_c0_g1_i1.p2  ORF type:complete len:108 (-),score=12.00 TRINITY_DN5452_c0_g1_i1:58-381(-)
MIIPQDHIIKRKNLKEYDIQQLKQSPWTSFDVLIQCQEALLYNQTKTFHHFSAFSDIMIPWGGLAGITLFYRNDNLNAMQELNKIKDKEIFLHLYNQNTFVSQAVFE